MAVTDKFQNSGCKKLERMSANGDLSNLTIMLKDSECFSAESHAFK